MSDGQLGPVLSAQPWRILCALREDSPRDADPVLRADEQLDGEAYETLWYELHHIVLPELAADGLVEFVSAEEQVWRGPQFETVRPLLDSPPEELPALDAGPFAYVEQSGMVRYYPEDPVENVAALLDGDGSDDRP
jgi:hypothetical protein